MSSRKSYRPWQPRQDFLLPPSPSEWLPKDHLVYFLLDVVDQLDLKAIEEHHEAKDPRGTRPHSPALMVALLLYAYSVGVFSSRKIERATYENVAFRVLAGGEHPHFTRINAFRKTHLSALQGLFKQMLLICQKAGLVKLGHVALDGTKIQANASKHKAMSYDHMQALEEHLQTEIAALLERAEDADAEEDASLGEGQPDEDIPVELQRRQERLQRIRQAKAELEAEARQARAARLRELAEGNDRRAVAANTGKERKAATTRAAKQRTTADELAPRSDDDDEDPPFTTDGGLPKHRPATTTDGTPDPRAQRNFTDPDSRIVESGGAFMQGYNCQAVVDEHSQIIVAAAITNQSPDNGNLAPMLQQAIENCGQAPERLSADAGYWAPSHVETCLRLGTEPYIATERRKHWESHDAVTTSPPPEGLSLLERMRHKLRTRAGRATYSRRKVIVEPVFGQVKEVRGFRRFSLRGGENADAEWSFVCTTHNLLKLWRASVAASAAC